ncbi:amino acid adenylation domain-containing protein [Amycolatopsis sp. OK19-0408]|uniref:Phenyloxazoline synthase MbtB n=1 Tax=Amycolatopsis iheyensis TaxID=2945988 RepID=A0A9X2N9D8_9PSEU|nr:non-ribosomal peptide synthetase [Amycolatopsis iheyensis]MCR6483373.1 amino acid adenylation domain-containing protein [Amycolatopsis iheyensis]
MPDSMLPLSAGQEALWFLHRYAPDSASYNVVLAVRFRSGLQIPRLADAVADLAERHDLLRSVFVEHEGRPARVVRPPSLVRLEVRSDLARAAAEPFDLGERGPFRAVVCPEESVLLLVTHHIATDFVSQGVLLRDLLDRYTGEDLPDLKATYADFVDNERRVLSSDRVAVLERYWTGECAGAPTIFELPADRPRPLRQSFAGATHVVPLDAGAKLRSLAREEAVSPFTVLLTAFQALLHRCTGQPDFLLACPTMPDLVGALKGVTGYFVNPVPVRARCEPDSTFRGLLRQTHRRVIGAMTHRDYPFPKLVGLLDVPRDPSRAPLAQIAFSMQAAGSSGALLDMHAEGDPDVVREHRGLELSAYPLPQQEGQFDLSLEVVETSSSLRAVFKYRTELFDAATIARLGRSFACLLESVLAEPGRQLSTLDVLDTAAHDELVELGAGASAELSAESAHELIAARVAESPRAVAVTADGVELSYAELDHLAGETAQLLLANGVQAGDRVGVHLRKGPRLAVAVLATLKAGATYLPLDPGLPADRIAFMLADTEARVVLSEPGLADRLSGVPVLEVGQAVPHAAFGAPEPGPVAKDAVFAWERSAPTSNLTLSTPSPGIKITLLPPTVPETAYLIYTSGSTGTPKGVRVGHRGLVNLAEWQREELRAGPGSVVLQFAPIGFDASVWELVMALGSGATLHFPPPEVTPAGAELAAVVADGGVTHLTAPPSVLATIAPADVPSLTHVVAAGEECPAELARTWSEHVAFYNGYGPTETTVCATAHRCRPGEGRPAIGRPLRNTRVYVTDDALRLVPHGAVGELVVSGVGVAGGYLGRPELTAGKFVDDPFGTGKAYRTGDLVRWRPDGTLEFLGRRDRQVKIRGFRVELGEVEALLSAHPDVRHAVATVAGRAIIAHVLPRDPAAPPSGVDEGLPGHLRPSAVHFVTEFPLTPNGKIDRAALSTASAAEPAAPRTAAERELAAILGAELELPEVGVHDDFFALGGHSLLAARLAFRVRERFGAELSLSQILHHPTVAAMAALIDRPAEEAGYPQVIPEPAAAAEPFPLTDVQQAYLLGRGTDFTLGGVSAHGYFELEGDELDPDRLTDAWNTVVRRHPMLRAVFDGTTQRVLPEVPRYEIAVCAPEELAAVRAEMSHQVLPADRWPLFDIRLTRLPGRSRLHLSFDGLVADGASLRQVLREWARAYDDPAAQWTPVGLDFRDYVLAEQRVEETERYRRARDYWQARVPELPAGPDLPVREGTGTPAFERLAVRLDPATWTALRRRAAAEGLSPSNVLLAAYAEVLAAWSRSRHFCVNLTLFNRLPLHEKVPDVVGDFTSLTLLEVDFREPGSFPDKARALQSRLWRDLDHRHYSGIRVQRDWVRAGGEGRRGATMPVVFTSVLDDGAGGWGFERFGELVESTSQTPQVWLDHVVVERDGGVDLVWNVVPELFPDGVLDDMFAAYRAFLGRLAADEGAWAERRTDFRSPADVRDQRAANATGHEWARVPLLHEPFFEVAEREPDRIAVYAADRTLSYGELAERADAVAAALRAGGVAEGEFVAVVLDKSWEQVAAVLGVLRAGAAYLPVNVRLPAARRALLLREAGARAVVTRSANLDLVEELEDTPVVVVVDRAPAAAPPSTTRSGEDLAYVIYTSGSTGKPKGVVIDHRSAVNTLLDVNRRYGITSADTALALSSLSFDLSVYDVFGVLGAGGTLVVPDHEAELDPAHWLQLVAKYQVTVWNSVPALMRLAVQWAELGDPAALASLRVVMLSGDWIPLTLPGEIRACAPEAEVIGMGGATEAAIWSNFHRVGEPLPGWPSVPYGKPLANQTFAVLDEALQPRPAWVPGELFIGGAGLAVGYLDDPELTAKKFIIHPVTGERLYRTGDWGRYRPGGILQFLGREDLQVKVNGNRIELGEIESVLLRHPGVEDAVVTAPVLKGDRRLVAYLVSEMDTVDAEDVRRHLREQLPPYMVPATVVHLDSLPLSANGKVDRARLPVPDAPVAGSGAKPASATERKLAGLWADALGLPEVGTDESFFVLGGDSLIAIRLLARVEEEFGVRLGVREVFETPTVGGLAALIDERPAEDDWVEEEL